jgi:hypothetical protein
VTTRIFIDYFTDTYITGKTFPKKHQSTTNCGFFPYSELDLDLFLSLLPLSVNHVY